MNSTGRVWARIRRIAASDRISGLIMLAFAFAGLVLANLPWTSHMFEAVAETQLGIPGTNIILPIGHWAQDGLLTIFFLTVGLDLKQELPAGALADPKAAAVPMLCAVGGMLMPPVLFITVISLFSRFAPPAPGIVTIPTGADVPFAEAAQGWAIPTATDIAFSLAVLALFAKALPGSIRAFLMTLATVDDLLAIILIAVFFSSVHRHMRGHLGVPGEIAPRPMAAGRRDRRTGMGDDVRGRRAPHAGGRAGRPADAVA